MRPRKMPHANSAAIAIVLRRRAAPSRQVANAFSVLSVFLQLISRLLLAPRDSSFPGGAGPCLADHHVAKAGDASLAPVGAAAQARHISTVARTAKHIQARFSGPQGGHSPSGTATDAGAQSPPPPDPT